MSGLGCHILMAVFLPDHITETLQVCFVPSDDYRVKIQVGWSLSAVRVSPDTTVIKKEKKKKRVWK